MKKHYLPFAVCGLLFAGCSGTIKPEYGSMSLVRIDAEPIGCQFLYKMDSEVSVYDPADAEQYLRNRIADHQRHGNVYWIVSQRTRPNEGVIFGPEKAYIMTANVYDCPNARNVATKKDSSVNEDFFMPPPERRVYGGM